MLCRSFFFLSGFRTSKLADEFSVVGSNSMLSTGKRRYDHVGVDIGPIAGVASKVIKGLLGADRDAETLRYIPKLVFNTLLKKFPGAKSIAIFMDGTDPLWKIRKTRVHPGKKFESRFYRSCCAPVAFQIEEKLRVQLIDFARQVNLPEFIFSGPSVPGPVECKISAWIYDLASRINNNVPLTDAERAQAIPPLPGREAVKSAFINVDANDSIVLIGQEELFLTALGAAPFHNITTVIQDQKDLKCLSLQEGMEWLGLESVAKESAFSVERGRTVEIADGERGSSSSPSLLGESGHRELTPLEKITRIRWDIVVLQLLANGCPTTDLGALCTFSDLMQAYIDLSHIDKSNKHSSNEKTSNSFFLVVPKRDDPRSSISSQNKQTDNDEDTMSLKVSLGVDIVKLEKLIALACRKHSMHVREDPAAAEYLEVLLQSLSMYCDGGIKNYGYVPQTLLTENPIPLRPDVFMSHLKFLMERHAKQNGGIDSNSGTTIILNTKKATTIPFPLPSSAIIYPSVDSNFALTPLQQLLLSFTENTETITQILPAFTGGHQIPDSLLKSITTNISEVKNSAQTAHEINCLIDPLTHPALRHEPSHYFWKSQFVTRQSAMSMSSKQSFSPMFGYEFAPINLGIRANDEREGNWGSPTNTLSQYRRKQASVKNEEELTVGAATAADPFKFEEVASKNCVVSFKDDRWQEQRLSELSKPEGDFANKLFKVITWNVQFNRHSGEKTRLGRAGVDWCTATRYHALSAELEEAAADVIVMQECETEWYRFLANQPWVLNNYCFSCHEKSNVLRPYGQLMLINKRTCCLHSISYQSVSGYIGQRNYIPALTLRFTNGRLVTIDGIHLAAPYNKNNKIVRAGQLESLTQLERRQDKSLRAPNGPQNSKKSDFIIVGDFNDGIDNYFTFPEGSGYQDAWLIAHPEHNILNTTADLFSVTQDTQSALKDSAYTINGARNSLAAAIIEPEFFGRADRVLFRSADQGLRPRLASLLGTAPVRAMELPAVFVGGAKCPDYLFPSDHFGVMLGFEVEN